MIGPGASGNTISPKLEIGLTSRVKEVRKASEASFASDKERSSSSTFAISIMSSRVIPARHPEDRAGVTRFPAVSYTHLRAHET